MPETTEVLEVVAVLYTTYRDHHAGPAAEAMTGRALTVLGWAEDRAYRAAAWVADNQ